VLGPGDHRLVVHCPAGPQRDPQRLQQARPPFQQHQQRRQRARQLDRLLMFLPTIEPFEAIEQRADLQREMIRVERAFGGAFAERYRPLDLRRRFLGFVDFGDEGRGFFLGVRLRSFQSAAQCPDLGFLIALALLYEGSAAIAHLQPIGADFDRSRLPVHLPSLTPARSPSKNSPVC
jgi:hypothetical protein